MDEGRMIDFTCDGECYTIGRPAPTPAAQLERGRAETLWRLRDRSGVELGRWYASDAGLPAVLVEQARLHRYRGRTSWARLLDTAARNVVP